MKDRMIFKFSLYGFLKNLQFFEPFIILFFLKSGLNFFQIGILISIREIFIEIFEIPTGIIADVLGKRISMIFSFCIYIVSFLIFYLSGSYFVLYVLAMIFFAGGEAFRTGTHKAIIFDYLDKTGQKDKKVEYYGTTRSFSKLGSALSAIIAAVLVFAAKDYSVVFLATIIPYICGLLLMISYPKNLEIKQKKSHDNLIKNFLIHTKESFQSLFKIKGLGKALVQSSTYEGIFKIAKDYLQPVLKKESMHIVVLIPVLSQLQTEQRVGIITGVVYSIIYILAAVSSKKSYKFNKLFSSEVMSLNFSYFFAVFLFVGISVFLHFELMFGVIIFFMLYHIMTNLRKPIMIGYLGEKINKKQRATILSVDSQLKSLFAMIFGPLFGLFADQFGLVGVFWSGSLLLFVLYLMLKMKKN